MSEELTNTSDRQRAAGLLNRNSPAMVEMRRLRVVSGHGAVRELGTEADRLGGRRVALLTDSGVRDAGHAAAGVAALVSMNREVLVFDQVPTNPTEGQVEAARHYFCKFDPDLIVAIGGGSVMDCGKGLNFLLTQGGRLRDYWGWGKAQRPMLPSIGVPCTAGTGSEAQSYALISNDDDHTKMACGDEKVRFSSVVLDPDLVTTAPRRVAAQAGLDAVSHAVESLVTKSSNLISRSFSREAWRLLSGAIGAVLCGTAGSEQIEQMQRGSHLSGWAIETSMLGAAHALANPLTAVFDLPHGEAVALTLPAVVRWNGEIDAAIYDRLVAVPPGETAASALADQLESWRDLAGFPGSLSGVANGAVDLRALAELAARQWTGRHNPRPLDSDAALELYSSLA